MCSAGGAPGRVVQLGEIILSVFVPSVTPLPAMKPAPVLQWVVQCPCCPACSVLTLKLWMLNIKCQCLCFFLSWSLSLQVFRTDLITAMKLHDSFQLNPDEYYVLADPWRQEWEKGVQVPVSPGTIPEPVARYHLEEWEQIHTRLCCIALASWALLHRKVLALRDEQQPGITFWNGQRGQESGLFCPCETQMSENCFWQWDVMREH